MQNYNVKFKIILASFLFLVLSTPAFALTLEDLLKNPPSECPQVASVDDAVREAVIRCPLKAVNALSAGCATNPNQPVCVNLGLECLEEEYPGCQAAVEARIKEEEGKEQGASGVAAEGSELPPLYDPLAGKNAAEVVGGLIQTVLSIVGSLALVLFVYAGIMWMTAGGNEEKVRKSIQIMVWAGIGLFVIFASYVVLNFVFRQVLRFR